MALTDNLLTYLKLDGNSTDSIGFSTQTDTNITYSAGNGKIIQGAGFNGSSSKISMNKTFNTGDYATISISCWIKLGTASQNTPIIGGFADGFWNQYGRGLIYNANTITAMGEANNDKTALTSTLTDTTGFHHIVGVFSSSGALYVDGTSVATGDISSGHTYSWFLGVDQSLVRFFNGAIDEVGIWSRALTSAEVTELYNGGSGIQYPFTKSSFFIMF